MHCTDVRLDLLAYILLHYKNNYFYNLELIKRQLINATAF